MAGSIIDHSLGLKKETTYGTAVTVDRFFEWHRGNSIDWDPQPIEGEGMQATYGGFTLTNRRVPGFGQASGSLKFDLLSKTFGTLLEGAVGTASSTVVSGATYQQLFTPTQAAAVLNSYTVQEGIYLPDGSTVTYTYAGCSIKGFEIDAPSRAPLTLMVDVDGRSLATGTAYATPSYTAASTLITTALPTSGAATIGGTLTVPTTTALGSTSGGTAAAIKAWNLKGDNDLDTGREVVGGRNQPTVGSRAASILKTTIEYDATTGATLRDAQINQTAVPLLLSVTTAESLSTGVAQLQLAVPAAFINSGAIPQPSDNKVITTDIEWKIARDVSKTAAYYLVLRTADSAL